MMQRESQRLPESGAPRYQSGTGSYAAWKGHPIHPMLVPIVIGFYIAAVLADFAYSRAPSPFWAEGASWLLVGTLVAGSIAAIPGIIDYQSIDRIRRLPIARYHAMGNAGFLLVVAWNYFQRLHHPGTVPSGGFTLTLLGFAMLCVSGWLGGEMSYRHGIGVSRGIGNKEEVSDSLDQGLLAAKAERSAATPEHETA